MTKWEFFTVRESGADYSKWEWRWRRVLDGGRIEESDATFVTVNACVADARKHGYHEEATSKAV